MDGKKNISCRDSWGYEHDPGLDLYCNIEGVDRSVVLRHAAENEIRRPPILRVHSHSGKKKAGMAAAAALVISFFFHR